METRQLFFLYASKGKTFFTPFFMESLLMFNKFLLRQSF